MRWFNKPRKHFDPITPEERAIVAGIKEDFHQKWIAPRGGGYSAGPAPADGRIPHPPKTPASTSTSRRERAELMGSVTLSLTNGVDEEMQTLLDAVWPDSGFTADDFEWLQLTYSGLYGRTTLHRGWTHYDFSEDYDRSRIRTALERLFGPGFVAGTLRELVVERGELRNGR